MWRLSRTHDATQPNANLAASQDEEDDDDYEGESGAPGNDIATYSDVSASAAWGHVVAFNLE